MHPGQVTFSRADVARPLPGPVAPHRLPISIVMECVSTAVRSLIASASNSPRQPQSSPAPWW